MLSPMALHAMQNIGKRIQFGGHGIMDGMKQEPSKYNTYRIERVMDDGDIIIRAYRCKSSLVMPANAQNQQYRIV